MVAAPPPLVSVSFITCVTDGTRQQTHRVCACTCICLCICVCVCRYILFLLVSCLVETGAIPESALCAWLPYAGKHCVPAGGKE